MATNVLDTVNMSQPVMPAGGSQTERKHPVPSLEEVGKAVCVFLKKLPDVKEVRMVKLARLDPEKGLWEAEVEVYAPNVTIRALGLSGKRDVLDCSNYLIRVDDQLQVIAYGRKDTMGGEK